MTRWHLNWHLGLDAKTDPVCFGPYWMHISLKVTLSSYQSTDLYHFSSGEDLVLDSAKGQNPTKYYWVFGLVSSANTLAYLKQEKTNFSCFKKS